MVSFAGPFIYTRSIGIILSLFGIIALIRNAIGLTTTMLNLWPMISLSVGINLILFHLRQKKGSKLALLFGTPATGFSLFFFLFSFQLLSWSYMARSWPVFIFFIGLTLFWVSRVNIKTLKEANLSLFIIGWCLMGNSFLFLLLTQNILSWSFWPYSPLLSGIWFLSAQYFIRHSITWTILGLITVSSGAFFVPFATGQLEWSELVNYQFAYFLLLSISFFLCFWSQGFQKPAFLSTSVILLGLALVTLLGPWLIGWNRFGWNLWPIILLIVGSGLLSTHGLDRQTWAAIIPGTILVLNGSFLWLFTSGKLSWHQLIYLWPTFPLIIGLSFVLASLSGGLSKLRVLFWTGTIMSAVSVLLYLFASWPVGLLIAGAILLLPIPDRVIHKQDDHSVSTSLPCRQNKNGDQKTELPPGNIP